MPELHVSKKNIGKLFSEMQNKKFIIPYFQRPYKWDEEKCETLWNDIEDFTTTDTKKDSDYFLGTIVFYINEKKDQEIIDGQQRITSFFLLLRAFFKKLEDMDEDEAGDVVGLKNQLAPCIWDINPISQKVSDKKRIHIQSLVATEEDNDTFHRILEEGVWEDDAKDNYSINYRFFKKKCDEYAQEKPMRWKELCIAILQKCIILPIECDTSEIALTIFSTLNDRGLQLADSDIFKVAIYNNVEDREEFANTWKELTQICDQGQFSIDDVFRYYSHVLRARSKDKSKEVGLRKFYAEDRHAKLKKGNLIKEVMDLANFWRLMKMWIEPDEKVKYVISQEARKYLHCLNHYPNEFWKYPTSVFFIKNQNSNTFKRDFVSLLKELVAFLFVMFIEKSSLNFIKNDIYLSCISLTDNNGLKYKEMSWDKKSFRQNIEMNSSSKISKALLLLDAYLNTKQKSLISSTFDIEHIFPRKWQNTNYNGWGKEDADPYLNRFGNKIVLEKKLNILAGNNYFRIKKKKYKDSKIAIVKELGKYKNSDWLKEDIEKREEGFKDRLITFFSGYLEIN